MTTDRIDIRLDEPYRGYWYAYDDQTYDGAPDSNSPQGRGKTKWEAIRDLIDQMEDREGE